MIDWNAYFRAARVRYYRILELLRWRLGTFLLGGTAALSSTPPFVQPFTQLSPAARDSFMQGWAKSSIPKILEVYFQTEVNICDVPILSRTMIYL